MTSANPDFRPLYERLVTPGHVLSARLRVALPTLTRVTIVAFALAATGAAVLLNNDPRPTAPTQPTSARAELIAQISGKFAFGNVTIAPEKIGDIVPLDQTRDALSFIEKALAEGKLAFDAEMMTRMSGAEFAAGNWTPGKIATVDAGDVVAFGMFVRGPVGVMRWIVVARKFDGKFRLAEMTGFYNAFIADRSRAVTLTTHPDTFARILRAN